MEKKFKTPVAAALCKYKARAKLRSPVGAEALGLAPVAKDRQRPSLQSPGRTITRSFTFLSSHDNYTPPESMCATLAQLSDMVTSPDFDARESGLHPVILQLPPGILSLNLPLLCTPGADHCRAVLYLGTKVAPCSCNTIPLLPLQP